MKDEKRSPIARVDAAWYASFTLHLRFRLEGFREYIAARRVDGGGGATRVWRGRGALRSI